MNSFNKEMMKNVYFIKCNKCGRFKKTLEYHIFLIKH